MLAQQDVVPFFGEDFQLYLPILLAFFCAATLFNLTGRVLRLLGIKHYQRGDASESFRSVS